MRTILALFGIILFAAGAVVGSVGFMGIVLSVTDGMGSMLMFAVPMVIIGMAIAGFGIWLLLRYKDQMGLLGKRLIFSGIPAAFSATFIWAMFLPDITGHWLLAFLALVFAFTSFVGFFHKNPEVALATA